jgi:hypothetical protein
VNSFQILYLCFGGFVIVSGLVMIGTYTLSYRWWRDLVGRMMVTYAGAEIVMSFLLLLAVVFQVGPHWFRALWFILQGIVGGCFCFQTWTILRLRHRRLSLIKESEHA